MRKRSVLFKVVRIGALVAVWAFITYTAYMHQVYGERPEGAPTIHALCPLGGLATLRETATTGEYLKRTHPSALILFVGLAVLAVVFRRAFCGWICPLGAMQEFFATIGRKLKWRRALHDNRVDGSIRWVKVAVLVVVIGLTWLAADLVFSPWDPWATYAHLTGGLDEIGSEFMIGAGLLVVTLVGSLFVDRLWCRYLCPLGGFLAVFGRLAMARVERDDDACIHCGKCDAACPVDIRVEKMQEVTTGECITCGECVNVCPAPGALQFRMRRRILSPAMLGVGALAIFFGMVVATKATGTWRSLPESMTQLVEHGGELSAANIRGFMTLEEIAQAYGIPAETLLSELGLPEDTPLDGPVNEIMHSRGREVEEVREVVAVNLGETLAQDAEEPQAPEGPEAGAESADGAPDPQAIKGTMTFDEVAETFGVETGTLLESLGLPADTPTGKPIAPIMKGQGREVQEVRDTVGEMQAGG